VARIAMRSTAFVALMALAGAAVASPLVPLKSGDLARSIAFGQELFRDDRVRVVMVYREIGECGGPISTCPDADLYISYHIGDLGEEPKVFRLPPAKDWKVEGWQTSGVLRIVTALPESNVDARARAKWKATVYDIRLEDLCGHDC
jgi:hypothetical protein